jgi:hypothetical protein
MLSKTRCPWTTRRPLVPGECLKYLSDSRLPWGSPAMDRKAFQAALQSIQKRAKKDPQFFHRLVYDPESILAELPDSRFVKAAFLGIDPNTIWGRILQPPGPVQGCGVTCGSMSCDDTCGGRTCGNTCTDSCGSTCGDSCDRTVHLPSTPGG